MNSIDLSSDNNEIRLMELETLMLYSIEYPKSRELHERRMKIESGYKDSDDFKFFLDYEHHYRSFMQEYSDIIS
jgi:hypothetical protein